MKIPVLPIQSAVQSFQRHGGRATAVVEKSMGIGKQRLGFGRIWGLFLFPAAVILKGNRMGGKPFVMNTALPLLLLMENSHTQVLVLTCWERMLYTTDKRLYHKGTL